ncbi:MAG: ring-cleaving dioxygenase [Beijerinckiaceae bacterium]
MSITSGLHHITAIAGDPRRNLAFYRDTLGLRLIKKTVNFDDPGTYHLYYGDENGTPGSVLTFFPWSNARPGVAGAGEATGTSFVVPESSFSWWLDRFAEKGVPHQAPASQFGENTIVFNDPDGMSHKLVARAGLSAAPSSSTEVPSEHAIRGFGGITLVSLQPERTAEVLAIMGYLKGATDGKTTRWMPGNNHADPANSIDVEDASGEPRGRSGAGTVHHVAFRAADDAAQDRMRSALMAAGMQVTEQLDRNYFRSIYFREPGGVLFEIATDAPGFAVDEAPENLGQTLMLPQWLEARRGEIEAALPELR